MGVFELRNLDVGNLGIEAAVSRQMRLLDLAIERT
jgi:hypothetical protein